MMDAAIYNFERGFEILCCFYMWQVWTTYVPFNTGIDQVQSTLTHTSILIRGHCFLDDAQPSHFKPVVQY